MTNRKKEKETERMQTCGMGWSCTKFQSRVSDPLRVRPSPLRLEDDQRRLRASVAPLRLAHPQPRLTASKRRAPVNLYHTLMYHVSSVFYLSNSNHHLSCRHPPLFYHLLSCVLQPSTLVSASRGSFRMYLIAASPCLLMSSHCRRSVTQPSHVRSTLNIFSLPHPVHQHMTRV
jgi:hypothetical protein